MNHGHIYFEIQVDEPQRAIRFYSRLFGWRFSEAKGAPVAYWRIETGGSMGGLLQRPLPAPAAGGGANAFVCSVEVDDFDGAQKMILQEGGLVALPKFAVPGTCWQGYFIDTEGNTFGVFEVDEHAGK